MGIVIFLIAYYLSKMLAKPFEKVTKSLSQVQEGFLDADISIPDYTETQQLAEAYNQMLARMKALDDSRQEFVSNVSHELKTPITSMKVLADSLLAQPDAPVELYQEFMADIAEEIDRENKIITDLLSLVKMDKKAADLHIENKNINEIFKEYSKNPYYMAKRGITYVLAHAFGIIPVVTDNPDYIRMFKVKKEKELAEAERKRAEREIEIIYEKYAPYLKYDVKRRIKNRQFKKRKRLERKNRPPRPYIPPQRTAEEQKAIDTEMKRLYKEYHVSAVGRMARHLKEKYRKQ